MRSSSRSSSGARSSLLERLGRARSAARRCPPWRCSRRSGSRSAARRRRGRGTARTPRRRPPATRASGRSTLLTTRITGSLRLQRLAQHEPRLRQRPLGGVDEQQHAVDHRQAALDLAAEVGVAGRVDDVQLDVPVAQRGVLGEDRDALLALQIHRVEHPRGHVLADAKGARLPQHRVDQRGLAVVDVRDDRDVPYVLSGNEHGPTRLAAHARGPSPWEHSRAEARQRRRIALGRARSSPRARRRSAGSPPPRSTSAGSALIVFMRCPATWQRMRCS